MTFFLSGKKPTQADLAEFLGVSVSAVKQYPKKKRELMILGLWLQRSSISSEKEIEKIVAEIDSAKQSIDNAKRDLKNLCKSKKASR